MMESGVLGVVWENLEILRNIVVSIPIAMVNNFLRKQGSAQNLLSNNPVCRLSVDFGITLAYTFTKSR